MQAQCTCCGSTDSIPVMCGISDEDDREVQAYWFILDEDGAPVHMGLDESGEIDYNFKISPELDLDVSEEDASLVYCPRCMGDLLSKVEALGEDEDNGP